VFGLCNTEHLGKNAQSCIGTGSPMLRRLCGDPQPQDTSRPDTVVCDRVWPYAGGAKSKIVRYSCKRLTSLAPTNEESAWLNYEGKNLDRKTKVSQFSVSDVTSAVSLDTNNQV
jgi:hypothetical protein